MHCPRSKHGEELSVFESDSKLLVDALSTKQGKSIFDTLVEDCREILKHFEEMLVVFIFRSANNIVHMLAQAGYFMSDSLEWCSIAPDYI